MKPRSFMLIASDPSGDLLAAELVSSIREKVLETDAGRPNDIQPLRTQLAPRFFGAGGPHMKAAGVDLACDMTQHSVIGFSEVFKNLLKFRRLFKQLLTIAIQRQPDVIIGVDYGGFNLRFAHAIKRHVRKRLGCFRGWNPKIVQYVSPQVWASRPGRAYQMAGDHDLVLSIFPFEKDWYATRVPKLRVQYVGHPMVDRFVTNDLAHIAGRGQALTASVVNRTLQILLLPGSRTNELHQHLPLMLEALNLIQSRKLSGRVCSATMVLPNESLVQRAKSLGVPTTVHIQTGDLAQALAQADLALAATGTVTLECAFFGVPAVTLYKVSWAEYQYAKRIVRVKWLTMPNILAGDEIFPEFVQDAATPENIAGAALTLLQDEKRRQAVKAGVAKVVASLGGPGANARAAGAIVELLR